MHQSKTKTETFPYHSHLLSLNIDNHCCFILSHFVNCFLCRFAVLSTIYCSFTYLPFYQLFSSTSSFNKLVFNKLVVSTTWYLINKTSCYINLPFFTSICCFIKLLFHQIGVSSNCCFIKLLFHQIGVSSNCCFIKLLFHQIAVSSTCCFIKLFVH